MNRKAADFVPPSARTGVRKVQPRAKPAELREVNEQLVIHAVRAEETVASLRAVAEFRERLIGVIGHDLRNPLNAILMAGNILVADGKLDGTEAKLAMHVLQSAKRMERMLRHVADFARARLGGFELSRSRADVGLLCEQIAAELRIGASAQIDVRARGDIVGMWDIDLLGQAISNIAGNATDHAAPGTSVLVTASNDHNTVVVAITNHGVPIPPAMLPVIFDPFRRGAIEGRERGHMGLGLYIARAVVEAHGGTIDVHSHDRTTTFAMRLPRLAVREERNENGEAQEARRGLMWR